jgi:hypothetical protein
MSEKKPKRLMLPSKQYGPLCSKILKDFILHNSLPDDLLLPETGLTTHAALSRIFDVLLHSMGKEKREAILLEVEEYVSSLPPAFR